MIIKDAQTPKGRILLPDKRKHPCPPCKTRQMTDEERERYGLPRSVPKRKRRPTEREKWGHDDVENVIDKARKNRTLAAKVKQERERRGMTLRQFASEVGTCHATIRNIENGKGAQRETIRRLCKVFGWEVEE